MANDKRFIVKNGLQTQNIKFVSTDETKNINTTINNEGTISFTGSNGNILSLSNTGNATVVGSVYGNNFYVGSWGQVIDSQGNWTGNKIKTNWITKNSNYTAEINESIIADTSAGAFTITLPANPSIGDSLSIIDGGNFSINNLTINGNGSLIENSYNNLIINVDGIRIDFVYNGIDWQVFSNVGPAGFTGSQGATGFTGSGYTGSRGLQGYTGSQGFQGYAGSRGYTGSQGFQGIQGFTGSQGIQGFTGSKGDTGLGFTIAKSYASVAALTADTEPTGIVAGQFAIIETGDVENPENSRLYLWNGSVYSYVSDLSGAQGITGPQGTVGYTGSQGLIGELGGIEFQFSTTTTDSDPGNGKIRYNSSSFYGISFIYVDNVDFTGVNTSNFFTDSFVSTNRGILYIKENSPSTVNSIFRINGNITTAAGYIKIPVIPIQGSVSSNEAIVYMQYAPMGYTGSRGIQGFTGSQGIQGVTGFTGSAGASGTNGTNGTNGYTGSRGIQGVTGFTGSAGTNGTTGFTGSAGLTGSQGIRGAGEWTPVLINVTQSSTDSTVYTKTGGSDNTFDAQVYSTQGYVRGAYVTAKPSNTTDTVAFGLNNNPTASTDYTNIDFAIYLNGFNSQVNVVENGVFQLSNAPFSASDIFTITYDGVNVRYWQNNTLLRTRTRAIGNPLYFDAVFYDSNAQINNVGFGPMGESGFTGSRGNVGFTGSGGTIGFTGSKGDVGFTGSKGNTGFTGSQGIQGVIGYTGSAGTGGGSGGSPWIYKTTNYTAVANDRIIADTSGGTITITLPATPVLSDMVTILDAGNANTTPITINRNGSTIEDSADNFVIDIENVQVEFVYDGTTWQVVSSVGRRGAIGYTGSRGLDGSFAGMGYTGSQGFTGSRGATTAVDVLAPTPATVGDFWFNTDQDQLKVYVDGQWVNSTPMYIPTGGTTNQILAKSSNTNYDFAWVSSVTETVYALAGTQISLANGSIQYKTQTTNTTYTETLTSGQSVTLLINSGGFLTTWPTISWVGGVAPTIALTGYSVIVLFKINSTLYGKHSGDVV